MWKVGRTFVPQAIFQPDCLIGNSETWENLSRITDSVMVFCPFSPPSFNIVPLQLLHRSSVFDSVNMETPDG